MNAREYLKGLNEHDPVWDMADEFEYTEDQLINFAERYHQAKLKLLGIGGVVKSLPKQRPKTTSTLYPIKDKKCFWCGNKR